MPALGGNRVIGGAAASAQIVQEDATTLMRLMAANQR
jgi:hypothetical protein